MFNLYCPYYIRSLHTHTRTHARAYTQIAFYVSLLFVL